MDVSREILTKLLPLLREPQSLILTGPRQVGKTFLLKQLHHYCDSNAIPARFYNLEAPEHLRLFSRPDEEIIAFLKESDGIVFIDEFHYIRNATKLFKAVYDTSNGRTKIVASGSSSLEMHGHLKESLAGRITVVRIHPLSYSEFLQTGAHPPFETYLKFGGLPGLVHAADDTAKMELLNAIVSTYLLKDVRALVREENVRAFNHLLYLLAQYQGSLVSISGLSRETRMTAPTLARYLDLLSGTFVLFPLASYAGNLSNELKKSYKYYLYDLGVRNLLLKDFSGWPVRNDKGVILESAVFLNLTKQLKPNQEIRFWRTKSGEEVDFVLLKDRIPVPVEVKSAMPEPEVPGNILKFFRAYPESPYAIVYNSSHETIKTTKEGKLVYFEPLPGSAQCRFFL